MWESLDFMCINGVSKEVCQQIYKDNLVVKLHHGNKIILYYMGSKTFDGVFHILMEYLLFENYLNVHFCSVWLTKFFEGSISRYFKPIKS